MGADGSQIGVVSTNDALRAARELDLDLVEVALRMADLLGLLPGVGRGVTP